MLGTEKGEQLDAVAMLGRLIKSVGDVAAAVAAQVCRLARACWRS